MNVENINNKPRKVAGRALVFIASWLVTFALELVFCIGCVWLVFLLNTNGSLPTTVESARYIVYYSVWAITVLTILYILIRKLAHVKFWEYASWALVVGIFINTFIFGGGVFMLFGATQQQIQSKTTTGNCSSLENQLGVAESSVVPISTDLGVTGTAFAVGDNSILLTAYHVIDGASSVYANYVGEKIGITVLSTSVKYDLAILKIDKPMAGHLNLTSNYRISDKVYVLGYPANTFSVGQASLSEGVLSRVILNSDLKLNDSSTADGFEIIQTDATANPGNSGGPIFNSCGVIGVIDARSNILQMQGVSSEQEINYAISSKTAAEGFALPIYDK